MNLCRGRWGEEIAILSFLGFLLDDVKEWYKLIFIAHWRLDGSKLY